MMSIHANLLSGCLGLSTASRTPSSPKDYETAISSHKESIIWSVIKMETHNYVCDLVGLESTVFDCLSILCKKVPLLDQEALSKKQVFDKHVMQHRLYTSSVQ